MTGTDGSDLHGQVRKDLYRVFAAELKALKPLSELMEEEQAALERQDILRIIEISTVKDTLLQSLQAATSQRLQTMQILGYDADADGLDKLLSWCRADSDLRQASDLIRELTANCHEMNIRNGMQINKNQEFVSKSLHILLGLGEDSFTGYNATGNRMDDGENRTITTA